MGLILFKYVDIFRQFLLQDVLSVALDCSREAEAVVHLCTAGQSQCKVDVNVSLRK